MFITSTPQELIEHILVIAAQDGYLTTVSSLSQTCKHFHRFLGVKAENRQLWRHLFLAVFEDPQQPDGRFDWKSEFVAKVQTKKWFRRWTAVRKQQQKKDEKEEEKWLLHSLRTLVKSITTENCPMYNAFPIPTAPQTYWDDTAPFGMPLFFGMPLSDAPFAFPSLIGLRATLSRQPTARERTQGLFSSFDADCANIILDCFGSSTSAWAEGVLKHGYPPTLAERLRTFDPWVYRRSVSSSHARAHLHDRLRRPGQ